MSNQNLKQAAELLRRKGRGNDTILAHINQKEAQILKAMGGSGLINPHTGLPEFCCGSSSSEGSSSSYSYTPSYSDSTTTSDSTDSTNTTDTSFDMDTPAKALEPTTEEKSPLSFDMDTPAKALEPTNITTSGPIGLASLGPSVNTPQTAFNNNPTAIFNTNDPTTGLSSLGPSVNSPDVAFDNSETAPLSANAEMQNILQNGFVRDASGNVVTDRYGVPILSGDAAKMFSAGLVHWDNIIGSPTYHQWVAGKSENGTAGSVGKNGEWNYGTAVNGMTMDELRKLSAEGQGGMWISDNQTVDHAINAMNFDKVMTKYIGPLIVAAVPGGTLAVNAAKLLGGLATGQTSFGDVASNLLIGLGANALGISPGTATALLIWIGAKQSPMKA
jgi:hypothetical protein